MNKLSQIWSLSIVLCGVNLTLSSPAIAQEDSPPAVETSCSDRVDNDGDTMIDCADADCYDHVECKSAGGLENTDVFCSDWIDNDGDGATDCDDRDCERNGVTVCQGSWKGSMNGTGVAKQPGNSAASFDMPALKEGMSVVDLLGVGSDADGERNNFVCSDGIDNDGDGRVDCQDIGCRFDPNVTICQGSPDIRFSVAASVGHIYDFETELQDTRFTRLQLRSFGPVPGVQDSFFLISMRAEKTPRLTFAMFSMPIHKDGHFININSGGGGLSNGLVASTAKNPMLEPAFYLFSAFEQGNGAALEFNGPIIPGRLHYRAFVAGGAGRFNGNIGGRFFASGEFNHTYGAGGALMYYALGRFGRWDTRYLYTSVPLALTLNIGGRYDQREFERFPAAYTSALFRYKRFQIIAEGFAKRELEFDSYQFAYNAMVGILVWPKKIMIAADVGQFYATEFKNAPAQLNAELKRLGDVMQWRAAIHYFLFGNTGLLSLLYTDQFQEQLAANREDELTKELRLEAQFRF